MKITKKQLKNIVEQAMRPAGRPIYEIAEEIYQAWPKVNPHAQPYLDAMQSLETVNDKYGMEDGGQHRGIFSGQRRIISRTGCQENQVRATKNDKGILEIT